jgi:hypothetical protein
VSTSLTRFRAFGADPKDPSGIATLTYAHLSVNVPVPSFQHAQQLGEFIDVALREARRQAKATAAAAIRGQLNTLENDA